MSQSHLVRKAFLAGLIVCSKFSFARSLTIEEADASVEHQLTKVTIQEDGRGTFSTSLTIKILNENGRSNFGTLFYKYRPSSMELKVAKAKIKNGKDTTVVRSENILDQTVVAGQTGFDDIRQVAVAFPHVRVGSELELQVEEKIKRADIPNHFSRRFVFGETWLVKNTEYQFYSKRQLHFELNDPHGALELIKNEAGGKFHYTLRTKKPIFRKVFDEVNPLTDDASQTWVVISTASDYPGLFASFAVAYEKAISASLPKAFTEIVEKVKGQPTPESQIAHLLAMFSERVRYMGDWRAVDGAFIPRSMTAVADSQSGDCKDMSVVVTRMLRELGFKAWVALVYRGPSAPNLAKIPHSGFNHAIVFVRLGEKTLWLDPTNFQSFPEGVFEDIGERQSLILDPANVRLEEISFPEPDRNIERVTTNVQLRKTSRDVDMKIYHSGSIALNETGALLRWSRSQFEEGTVTNLSKQGAVLKYKFDLPEMKSRIVQPVEMNLSFEQRLRPIETSMGPAMEFAMPKIVSQVADMDAGKRIDHFRLGPPSKTEDSVTYSNIRFLGDRVKNCEVKSLWMDFKFIISKQPARVSRSLTIKKFKLQTSDFKTPEYKRFHEQVKRCSQPKTVLYQL